MATTTTRDDCGVQTLALLRRSAGLRGLVGTCIVRGGRSLLTLEPVPGVALPWTHHVWAIGPDGVLQDPTADGLLPDSIREWYEPPAPLEQLRPAILWNRAAQAAALARLRPLAVADSTPFEPIEAPGDLIYLPGRVSESLRGPRWHRLAKRSQTPGGFSAADLAGAVERCEPSQRRACRGFA